MTKPRGPEHHVFGSLLLVQSLHASRLQPEERFDLSIAVAGFEDRTVKAWQSCRPRAEREIFLRFKSHGTPSEMAKFEAAKNISSSTLKRCIPGIKQESLSASIDVDTNFQRLSRLIEEEVSSRKRSIRLAIDVTCLPKVYLCFLFGLCFRRELCSSVDFFYSEGMYLLPRKKEPRAERRSDFTIGEWNRVPVPFFVGAGASGLSRHLLVSLGAEVQQAEAYVTEYEPTRCGVVSVVNEKSRLDLSRIKGTSLLSSFERATLDNGWDFHKFDMSDVQRVAVEVEKFLKLSGDEATTIFSVGCKPHALGFCVGSFDHDKVDLQCRVPLYYPFREVKALGPVHRYTVIDRFDPGVAPGTRGGLS